MTTTRATNDEIDLVDRLDQAMVNAADSSLRRDGSVQRPVVHMIVGGYGYVGFIESRPFYRGADAVTAIREMGFMPAAMYATRLVVSWEQVDILVSLGETERSRGVGNAQVVLDARSDGSHTMRVHPFDTVVLDPRDALRSSVLATWGAARHVEDARLPEPVEELLILWRQGFNPRQLPAIIEQLGNAGYSLHLYGERSKHSRAAPCT